MRNPQPGTNKAELYKAAIEMAGWADERGFDTIQFSEHHGSPDGYIDVDGVFHKEKRGATDKPVYEVELKPEDGLYPLPYVAMQANGKPWEEEGAEPFATDEMARQGFFPDGSRSFEDIDRMSIGAHGTASQISAIADVDFYRLLPPGGYRKGLPAADVLPPEEPQYDPMELYGVVPQETCEFLADTYRDFRRRVHRQTLEGRPAHIPPAEAEPARTRVRELWAKTLS